MTKRKKQFFPTHTTNRRAPAPGSDASPERPNLATINLEAGAGKVGLAVGDRVRIADSGLYSGETATIEKLTSGVIPSALVRTDGGGSRQVRTIDLSHVAEGSDKPEAAKGQAEAPKSQVAAAQAPEPKSPAEAPKSLAEAPKNAAAETKRAAAETKRA